MAMPVKEPDPRAGTRSRRYARRNPNTVCDRSVLADMPLDPKRWKAVLAALLRVYNRQHATKMKDVSFATQEDRETLLYAAFGELREAGYKLDPRSLGDKHVKLLVTHWVARGLAAGTIQDYLAILRTFGNWIGKPGLVRQPECYVDDPEHVKRCGVAQRDKSWIGHGVDVWQIIVELAAYDEHAAVHVLLMYMFGLRVKEVAMLRPHVDVVLATALGIVAPSAEYYLWIRRGAKGKRRRPIPIDSPEKWEAIKRAQNLVSAKRGHLGYPGLSLKQTLKRISDVLTRFGITEKDLGITAHGLRHQYGHGVYRAAAGVEPPVRGGPAIDPKLDTAARLKVAEQLGHARKQISGAYLGGILRAKPSDEAAPAAPAGDAPATNPVSQPQQKEDV